MELMGPLQLRVMQHLWDKGPAPVQTVLDHLNDTSSRKIAYTTVLTVMRNLTRRKFCSTVTDGRKHVWTPLVSREVYTASVVADVCTSLFKGDYDKFGDFLASPALHSDRAKAKT